MPPSELPIFAACSYFEPLTDDPNDISPLDNARVEHYARSYLMGRPLNIASSVDCTRYDLINAPPQYGFRSPHAAQASLRYANGQRERQHNRRMQMDRPIPRLNCPRTCPICPPRRFYQPRPATKVGLVEGTNEEPVKQRQTAIAAAEPLQRPQKKRRIEVPAPEAHAGWATEDVDTKRTPKQFRASQQSGTAEEPIHLDGDTDTAVNNGSTHHEEQNPVPATADTNTRNSHSSSAATRNSVPGSSPSVPAPHVPEQTATIEHPRNLAATEISAFPSRLEAEMMIETADLPTPETSNEELSPEPEVRQHHEGQVSISMGEADVPMDNAAMENTIIAEAVAPEAQQEVNPSIANTSNAAVSSISSTMAALVGTQHGDHEQPSEESSADEQWTDAVEDVAALQATAVTQAEAKEAQARENPDSLETASAQVEEVPSTEDHAVNTVVEYACLPREVPETVQRSERLDYTPAFKAANIAPGAKVLINNKIRLNMVSRPTGPTECSLHSGEVSTSLNSAAETLKANHPAPEVQEKPPFTCLECGRNDCKRLIKSARGPKTICDKCGLKARRELKNMVLKHASEAVEDQVGSEDTEEQMKSGRPKRRSAYNGPMLTDGGDPFDTSAYRTDVAESPSRRSKAKSNRAKPKAKVQKRRISAPFRPTKTPVAGILRQMFVDSPLQDMRRRQPYLANLLQADATTHFQRVLRVQDSFDTEQSTSNLVLAPLTDCSPQVRCSPLASSQTPIRIRVNDAKPKPMTFSTPVVVVGQQARKPSSHEAQDDSKATEAVAATDTRPTGKASVLQAIPSRVKTSTPPANQASPIRQVTRIPSAIAVVVPTTPLAVRMRTEAPAPNNPAIIEETTPIAIGSRTDPRPDMSGVHWLAPNGLPATPYLSTQAAINQAQTEFQEALAFHKSSPPSEITKQTPDPSETAPEVGSTKSDRTEAVHETPAPAAPADTQALFDAYTYSPVTPATTARRQEANTSSTRSTGMLKSILRRGDGNIGRHRFPIASLASKAANSRSSLSSVFNALTSPPANSPAIMQPRVIATYDGTSSETEEDAVHLDVARHGKRAGKNLNVESSPNQNKVTLAP